MPGVEPQTNRNFRKATQYMAVALAVITVWEFFVMGKGRA